MTVIKPVSDLHNYTTVLDNVAVGQPVFLTKNGRGAYAIIDIADEEEYEKTKAELVLMTELQKGKNSGEKEGYLSFEQLKSNIEKKINEISA